MTNPKFTQTIAIVAGIIIFFLLITNDKQAKQIKELKKEIDENDNLTSDVKKQLNELIRNNADIEPQVANELGQIAALLEIKQDTSAVLKLAKIIENLLKDLYKGEEKVKEIAKLNNRKIPVFADYIEHGKNEKIISKEDYHLLLILKLIRNEEAHDLDVKKEKSRVVAAFVSGMGLILGLCRILKKKKLPETT